MANERLYLSALRFASAKAVDPDAPLVPTIPRSDFEPEEAGARDGDLQFTHRSRCARLCHWISSRSFYFGIPIAEVVHSLPEALTYSVFGRDKKSINVAAMLDNETSPIGKCLGGFWQLLTVWSADKQGPWRILRLSGWEDFSSQDVRLRARAEVLHLAAGVYLHDDVKFSSLPWLFHRLVSPQWSAEYKRDLCNQALAALPCNVPLFVRQFRERFNTVDTMLSPLGLVVVEAWAGNKDFSTKASETGHATERRALASNGAAGQAFLHHSRRHLLHRVKTDHVAQHGRDPSAAVTTRGRSALPSVPAVVPDDPLAQFVPAEKLPQLEDRPVSADALGDIGALARGPAGGALPAWAPLAIEGGAAGASAKAPPPPPPELAPEGGPMEANAARGSGAGGSVYMWHLNKVRREFALGLGGRKMTPAEMAQANIDAKQSWGAMTPEEREATTMLYQASVARRQERALQPTPVQQGPRPRYTATWGIGTPESPISAKKFCEAHLCEPIPHWLSRGGGGGALGAQTCHEVVRGGVGPRPPRLGKPSTRASRRRKNGSKTSCVCGGVWSGGGEGVRANKVWAKYLACDSNGTRLYDAGARGIGRWSMNIPADSHMPEFARISVRNASRPRRGAFLLLFCGEGGGPKTS